MAQARVQTIPTRLPQDGCTSGSNEAHNVHVCKVCVLFGGREGSVSGLSSSGVQRPEISDAQTLLILVTQCSAGLDPSTLKGQRQMVVIQRVRPPGIM